MTFKKTAIIRTTKAPLAALLLSIFCLLLPHSLQSQELDLLVSPGKLSKVHAEFSGIKNCAKCHTAGKQTDPLKCLDCHKDLAERIKQKKGYHRDKKKSVSPATPNITAKSFN